MHAAQVRERVNALSEAFQRRSDERVTSTVAHKLAAGTFALQQALSSGRPYEGEVRLSPAVYPKLEPAMQAGWLSMSHLLLAADIMCAAPCAAQACRLLAGNLRPSQE